MTIQIPPSPNGGIHVDSSVFTMTPDGQLGLAGGGSGGVQVPSDWNATSGVAAILNKPTLATVATTGNYADLLTKPTLAAVAVSGAYADLSGKPTIPAAQVASDWNATTGLAAILNKPTLATVATTGNYADLLTKPTIPAAAVTMVASGTGHTGGLTPDPGATAGTTRYLREDATWVTPPSSGGSSSVMGASGTNHAAGLAPDPGATAATARFLREDATYASPVLGNGSTVPTLRNIATRCRHDYQQYATNYLIAGGRSVHVNMGDAVYGPQIVLGNWIANNSGESVPTGGAITEWAALEYPAGHYTMISWDAANGGSATRTESINITAGGADVVSDPIPIYLPKGVQFWIRRFSRFTSGTSASFPVSSAISSGSDVGWVGLATDETGTAIDGRAWLVGYSSTGNGFYFTGTGSAGAIPIGGTAMGSAMRYPLAILGMSTVASALVLGDSRNSGYNDSNAFTITANPQGTLGSADWGRWGLGEICRSLGHARPYTNLGCPTDAAYGYVANSPNGYRTRQQAYHTDVIVQYGVNDVNLAGRTAAATETALTTIYGYFPTKRVWQSTILPVSTSTDSWATNANQTTATTNTQRVLLNNWIRANTAGIFGYFENATVIEGTKDSGIWNVVTGLGAPTGDGLHPTPLYYKYIDTQKSIDPTRLTAI